MVRRDFERLPNERARFFAYTKLTKYTRKSLLIVVVLKTCKGKSHIKVMMILRRVQFFDSKINTVIRCTYFVLRFRLCASQILDKRLRLSAGIQRVPLFLL